MENNFPAHSSVISCYKKKQLVNVVCYNTRYRNRKILLPEVDPTKAAKIVQFLLTLLIILA